MRTCHLVIQKKLYVQIKKNSGATPKTTTLPTTHHMGELWTKLWFWVPLGVAPELLSNKTKKGEIHYNQRTNNSAAIPTQ